MPAVITQEKAKSAASPHKTNFSLRMKLWSNQHELNSFEKYYYNNAINEKEASPKITLISSFRLFICHSINILALM